MKNKDNAIEVENVKKSFKVYYDKGITLKDKVLSRGRGKYELREVLRGISFEVKKGEAIGLIGKNGCGKSTTLKLLTKIIYPNSGKVELCGRVSSLLELGAGFHPDMSGLENIYMNAAVFGLNRKEIDKRVKDIIKFSELEEFIDNPVRTYSSGMYMRLAFSVAINVDADVLLIDEILAVGDISFQKKCFEKLKEIKMRGTTIVIVSHSLDQIEKICDRSIWIEEGLIKEVGKPKEIHEHYLEKMEKERLQRFQDEYYAEIEQVSEGNEGTLKEKQEDKENTIADQTEEFVENPELTLEHIEEDDYDNDLENNDHRLTETTIAEQIQALKMNLLQPKDRIIEHIGNKRVYFTDMYVTNQDGQEKLYFETGENITLYLKYKAQRTELTGTLCLMIYRDDGVYCYGSNTYIEHSEIKKIKKEGYLKITLNEIPLLPSKYYFSIGIHDEQAEIYDLVEKSAFFQIYSNKGELGITRIKSFWKME